jgi:hypothetical protein
LPYFETTRGFKKRYIPIELCILDGLDDEVRSDHNLMRELLSRARKDPSKKYLGIKDLRTNFL